MNFSMYRDTKRNLYEEVIRSCREKEDMKENIEDKINVAIKRLEDVELKQKQEIIEQGLIEKEINETEEILKNEYKNYRQLASVVDKLKNEKNELNDRESSNQLLLVNCKQEIACLKTQIVGDPTKLLELLTEMKEMVSKEKIQIENFESKKNQIIKNNNFFENLKSEIMEQIKKCVTLNNNLKKKDELERKISAINNEIESKINNSDGLRRKIALLEKQIEQMKIKLVNLKENSEYNGQDVINKMANLKISYDKIYRDRMTLGEKIQANIKWAKEIESEMINKYEEYTNFVNEKKMFLLELKENTATYFNELKYTMSKYNQSTLNK